MYEKDIAEIKEQLAQVSKISAELSTVKYLQKLKKRNIIIFILSILLAISICLNLYYLLGYQKITETTETVTTTTFEGIEQNADNGGSNNVIGGDYNGNTEN